MARLAMDWQQRSELCKIHNIYASEPKHVDLSESEALSSRASDIGQIDRFLVAKEQPKYSIGAFCVSRYSLVRGAASLLQPSRPGLH